MKFVYGLGLRQNKLLCLVQKLKLIGINQDCFSMYGYCYQNASNSMMFWPWALFLSTPWSGSCSLGLCYCSTPLLFCSCSLLSVLWLLFFGFCSFVTVLRSSLVPPQHCCASVPCPFFAAPAQLVTSFGAIPRCHFSVPVVILHFLGSFNDVIGFVMIAIYKCK